MLPQAARAAGGGRRPSLRTAGARQTSRAAGPRAGVTLPPARRPTRRRHAPDNSTRARGEGSRMHVCRAGWAGARDERPGRRGGRRRRRRRRWRRPLGARKKKTQSLAGGCGFASRPRAPIGDQDRTSLEDRGSRTEDREAGGSRAPASEAAHSGSSPLQPLCSLLQQYSIFFGDHDSSRQCMQW
ncbi:unnamed protein product [Prorocentrum cordatum]|uniref:Uncharacterized protein n=1 Tax=Prorocentrum cordatum TaxID=2364126 RepID=A0ABN9W2W5_9DINO|nr:unnamed protein product [Polarella glacialis]